MRMALSSEVINVEVRGSGLRNPRNAPQPGFMSVPFTGDSSGSFWVITYSGHRHQPAEGNWYANGTGVFSDALNIPGESAVFKTSFQDGWSALSGLYKLSTDIVANGNNTSFKPTPLPGAALFRR